MNSKKTTTSDRSPLQHGRQILNQIEQSPSKMNRTFLERKDYKKKGRPGVVFYSSLTHAYIRLRDFYFEAFYQILFQFYSNIGRNNDIKRRSFLLLTMPTIKRLSKQTWCESLFKLNTCIGYVTRNIFKGYILLKLLTLHCLLLLLLLTISWAF